MKKKDSQIKKCRFCNFNLPLEKYKKRDRGGGVIYYYPDCKDCVNKQARDRRSCSDKIRKPPPNKLKCKLCEDGIEHLEDACLNTQLGKRVRRKLKEFGLEYADLRPFQRIEKLIPKHGSNDFEFPVSKCVLCGMVVFGFKSLTNHISKHHKDYTVSEFIEKYVYLGGQSYEAQKYLDKFENAKRRRVDSKECKGCKKVLPISEFRVKKRDRRIVAKCKTCVYVDNLKRFGLDQQEIKKRLIKRSEGGRTTGRRSSCVCCQKEKRPNVSNNDTSCKNCGFNRKDFLKYCTNYNQLRVLGKVERLELTNKGRPIFPASKCAICQQFIPNAKALGMHISKSHLEITTQQYILEHVLKTPDRPLCACGCGRKTDWNSGELNWRKYISGHNTISLQEEELGERLKKILGVNEVVAQFSIPSKKLSGKKSLRIYDFYAPSLNLLVEFDGDYWHGLRNRTEFGYTMMQIKNIFNDKIKDLLAIKKGYNLLRFSSQKKMTFSTIEEMYGQAYFFIDGGEVKFDKGDGYNSTTIKALIQMYQDQLSNNLILTEDPELLKSQDQIIQENIQSCKNLLY